jgi:hypothetical protein
MTVFRDITFLAAGPASERGRSAAEESVVEYDEDRELTRYVWDHYQRFLTERECRVGRAIIGRAKADVASSKEMVEILHRKLGGIGDAETEDALANGAEVFRRLVRNRLLSQHAVEIYVNRCPRCSRVVRSPSARQCLWCGFDWHE